MGLTRRRGFVASPRLLIPIIVIVVLLIFVSSFGSGDVSGARLAATAIVGVLLLALFAALALISRARAKREGRQD